MGILQIYDRLEAVADNLLSRAVIFNRRISWGILETLDRLEAAADNLLSRLVIFNRRISWGSSRFLTGWRL